MSDDIESFVHVLYYLVLRFHETLETSTLVCFVHVLLQAEEIVENEKDRSEWPTWECEWRLEMDVVETEAE